MIAGTIISYLCSVVFLILGFHKMFAYDPGGTFRDSVNAYVGGDAYNYIINANYATGYFTLAIFCAIIGLTFVIAHYLSLSHNSSKVSIK
ncbi:MAG: hypothetical protein ACOX1J_03695 [Dethiobacteria bacterium]|jgi:hypothetical protein